MKKPVLLLLVGTIAQVAIGQDARIVINGTLGAQPYIVYNPSPMTAGAFANEGAYIVIDNPTPQGIWYQPANSATYPGNLGVFRSEAEQNKIRWAIGNTAGTYTIPYADNLNAPLPFSLTKAAVGGVGSMVFSTYNSVPYQNTNPWGGPITPTSQDWDNTLYMASIGVTHMNDYVTGLPNNSLNAVNRFWNVDPQEVPNPSIPPPYTWTNYAVAPTCTLSFVHRTTDLDAVAAGGQDAIVANSTDLSAQRFNTTLNQWGDVLFPTSAWAGTATTGQVSNVIVSGANFFRAWTLTTRSAPLPIELTSWTGVCDGKDVKLTWTTATERNSEYFAIEKSVDGQEWMEIGRLEAAGNSTQNRTYTFVDEYTNGLAYYRLVQADLGGNTQTYDVVAAGCDVNSTEIVNSWDDGDMLNVVVSSTDENVYDITLSDAQGKVMVSRASQAINKGLTSISLSKAGIASGVYVVTLQNESNVMTRRVFLH
jgi:hypothetical protein